MEEEDKKMMEPKGGPEAPDSPPPKLSGLAGGSLEGLPRDKPCHLASGRRGPGVPGQGRGSQT